MEISDYIDSADDPVCQRVVAAIQSGLRDHNRSRDADRNAGQIVLAVHGAGQEVLAGLICDVAYGWLTVEALWVAANQRANDWAAVCWRRGSNWGVLEDVMDLT